MATWRIYQDLRTTYTDPRAMEGAVQDCGKPENPGACMFEDILDWAARTGDRGDFIYTSRGLFFVQGAAPLPH
jgi:hypothetical protein